LTPGKLPSSFSQIKNYDAYIANQSPFGTHQGVKGLEFPRVMVILDDEEARGFLFSYEKLFGVKALTTADLNNIRDGRDTTVLRTMRLFYVACSRAEKSLAVVAYTENASALKAHVLKEDWFTEDEIIVLATN
jgi:DNA helicase-2/ATP-dependent DNA helicase PcrA